VSTPPPTSPAEPTVDDGLDDALLASDPGASRWIGPAIAVAVVFALVGLPWAVGYGPLGVRLVTSHRVAIHVLNLSGGDVDVQLPFERRTVVRAGTLETLETLSGTIEIVTWDDELQESDRFTVEATGPMLYDVGATQCLAVFDVTGMYGGRAQDAITFVEAVVRQRTYAFRADTVLLPRRTPPDTAVGTVHWIEPVDCETLTDGDPDDLLMWAEYRLRLRRERFEENRRRGP
jgi:hypothetical protein